MSYGNSPTSSASSMRPHTSLTEQHHRLKHHSEDDIDMQSDNSDFDLNSDFSLAETATSAELGPIRMIPTEVLLLIFSHINHKPELVPLLTVCKRWANLIVELFWFRPALMGPSAMRGLQRVMQMDRAATYWDYRLYIRRLNLSFVYDKVDDHFLGLFQGCANLERLTLVNCHRLSSQSICTVLKGCYKLQSIDMTGVKNIDDSIFSALGANSHRLQGLYAPGCRDVTRQGIAAIYNNCPMLKRMKISDNLNVLDEDLTHFVENCKSLIEVDVHSCGNLSNHSLFELFTQLEQLREFRISQNVNITDQLFRTIPQDIVLERLRIIDFTGCTQITDQSVDRFVQAAPRLRNVVLSKCTMVTDSSLRSLSRLGKNLHYIHLGHCTHITDLGISILARSCHRLQYIDLACCQQLTNMSLGELAHLPRLRRIGLVKCLNITDNGIQNFVFRRGNDDTLERVHLSYCSNLGLSPILDLLRSCPRLTHLSLTGIRAFLRPDILCYSRDPPADFTDHQRTQFCVFSGQGVRKLRDGLMKLCREHPEQFERPFGAIIGGAGIPPAGLGVDAIMNAQLANMGALGVFPHNDIEERFEMLMAQQNGGNAEERVERLRIFERLVNLQQQQQQQQQQHMMDLNEQGERFRMRNDLPDRQHAGQNAGRMAFVRPEDGRNLFPFREQFLPNILERPRPLNGRNVEANGNLNMPLVRPQQQQPVQEHDQNADGDLDIDEEL